MFFISRNTLWIYRQFFSYFFIHISSWPLSLAFCQFFFLISLSFFILFKCAHTRWTILNDPLSRSLAKPKRRRQTEEEKIARIFFIYNFFSYSVFPSFLSHLIIIYMSAKKIYMRLNRFVASLSGSVTNDSFFLFEHQESQVGNN